MRFLDGELGRLFNYLVKTDELKRSIIVFIGDHGENFYDHDLAFNHEGLYDDVTKVPFILWHPSLPSKSISALVQHVDVLPTALELLRIQVPNSIDGKSLPSLIMGKKESIRDFVYFEDISFKIRFFTTRSPRRRGIRVDNYKYIESFISKKDDVYRVIPKRTTRVREGVVQSRCRSARAEQPREKKEKCCQKTLESTCANPSPFTAKERGEAFGTVAASSHVRKKRNVQAPSLRSGGMRFHR